MQSCIYSIHKIAIEFLIKIKLNEFDLIDFHFLLLRIIQSTNIAPNHAAGNVADEEDDEDPTMMTAPSIQRIADAANLKSKEAKPTLQRTTSV